MELNSLLEYAVVALYFTGALLFPAGLLGQKPKLGRVAATCALTGFALHTTEIVLRFVGIHCKAFYQGELYLSLMAWVMLLVFFLIWWRKRLDFMALAASPLALILYLSSISMPPTVVKIPKNLSSLFFTLHIGALMTSIALLAIAFVAGLLFLHMEKKIKTKERLTGFRKDLPSLSTFDEANRRSVMWGFPLYTVGLLSGFIWARFTWGTLLSWDPKEIVSLGIWVLFAYLFHQRLTVGWRGRKAATLAMVVFVLCMGSLLVVNFMFPSHHNFVQ